MSSADDNKDWLPADPTVGIVTVMVDVKEIVENEVVVEENEFEVAMLDDPICEACADVSKEVKEEEKVRVPMVGTVKVGDRKEAETLSGAEG